jgi:hypothetical protein
MSTGTGLETMAIRIAGCGSEIDKLDTTEGGKEGRRQGGKLSIQLSFLLLLCTIKPH